jgi:hypothetical protein
MSAQKELNTSEKACERITLNMYTTSFLYARPPGINAMQAPKLPSIFLEIPKKKEEERL